MATETRYEVRVKTEPSFIHHEYITVSGVVPDRFDIGDPEAFAWSLVVASSTDWNSYGYPIRETMTMEKVTTVTEETREKLL